MLTEAVPNARPHPVIIAILLLVCSLLSVHTHQSALDWISFHILPELLNAQQHIKRWSGIQQWAHLQECSKNSGKWNFGPMHVPQPYSTNMKRRWWSTIRKITFPYFLNNCRCVCDCYGLVIVCTSSIEIFASCWYSYSFLPRFWGTACLIFYPSFQKESDLEERRTIFQGKYCIGDFGVGDKKNNVHSTTTHTESQMMKISFVSWSFFLHKSSAYYLYKKRWIFLSCVSCERNPMHMGVYKERSYKGSMVDVQ